MATNNATEGTFSEGPAKRAERWKIPLIGHLPTPTQFKIAGAAMAVFMVGTVVSAAMYIRAEGINGDQKTVANELSTFAHRIEKASGLAILGDSKAYTDLERAKRGMDEGLSVLTTGGMHAGVRVPPAASGVTREKLDALAKAWRTSVPNIQTELSGQQTMEDFSKTLNALKGLDDELYSRSRFLAAELESRNADPRQLAAARRLPVLSQRMIRNANELFSEQDLNSEAAFLLGKDLTVYQRTLEALQKGSEVMGVSAVADRASQEQVAGLIKMFGQYAVQVSYTQRNQAKFISTRAAYTKLKDQATAVTEATVTLVNTFDADSERNNLFLIIGFVFFAGFLSAIALLVKIFADEGDAAKRAAEVLRESQVQQDAIMRLLDEISAVAEGDLTIKATVAENFTGAIADSINFTVAELRRVILNIIETAQRVDETSNTANQISSAMALSAKDQYDRLAKTGENIVRMSSRMDDIAQNTTEAVGAARTSLEDSRRGIQVVEESIARMNSIRDTIQETSKKIKLLGESSTAIGEVTGLIRDITKQINILALNAAIQAASAGEAGRGFAVVAQEVQRLAESSADAARRIDDLVLTIQDDAKGAVSSMEDSTREVVEGARLTDRAGGTLKEIGESVQKVVKEIEIITEKIEVESEEATNVSLDMRLLQEFTEKTLEDSARASDSVSQVKQISAELKESVSNFKV